MAVPVLLECPNPNNMRNRAKKSGTKLATEFATDFKAGRGWAVGHPDSMCTAATN